MAMSANPKLQLVLSRPADPSLQAYKDWINETTKALGGNMEEDIPEEEWVRGWKKFCGSRLVVLR
jgi:hypothetical protein